MLDALDHQAKALPSCAGVGNDNTLTCCLPRWRPCCGGLELPLEVVRVKTQFQLSGWTTTTFVHRVLLVGIVLETCDHVQVVEGWSGCHRCM
jgi:hypothetical protein